MPTAFVVTVASRTTQRLRSMELMMTEVRPLVERALGPVAHRAAE
jgi:hypothetical protein